VTYPFSEGQIQEALKTHCLICGVQAGVLCRNVSPKSPPLNRPVHGERVTAKMHKSRTK